MAYNSRPPVITTKLRKLLFFCPEPAYRVAAFIGIHPTRLSEYSLGKRDIDEVHLMLLCEYFQCPPEDIVGDLIEPFFTGDGAIEPVQL